MDRDSFRAWIHLYERAWRTTERPPLDELFAEGATYRTAPFEPPFRGLDAIAAMWESQSGPDEVFEMSYRIVAVEDRIGVARVDVLYGQPVVQQYADIWIVELDERNKCIAFEEWPFWPPGRDGGWVKGPKDQRDDLT